jgi:hypothetical protein
MAWMQPCSADLRFKVCGFERGVVLQGRFKAAESESDSALLDRRGRSQKENKIVRLTTDLIVDKSDLGAQTDVYC